MGSKISSPKTELKAWEAGPFAVHTVYQAESDGIVVGYARATGQPAENLVGFTDSSSPDPTTKRVSSSTVNTLYMSVVMPVKKKDYWKITLSTGDNLNIFWIPLR